MQGLQPITQNVDQIAQDVWAEIAEGTFTYSQFMRIMAGALAGKSSGHDLAAPVYRNLSDTKAVITATSDNTGRLTVVHDGS